MKHLMSLLILLTTFTLSFSSNARSVAPEGIYGSTIYQLNLHSDFSYGNPAEITEGTIFFNSVTDEVTIELSNSNCPKNAKCLVGPTVYISLPFAVSTSYVTRCNSFYQHLVSTIPGSRDFAEIYINKNRSCQDDIHSAPVDVRLHTYNTKTGSYATSILYGTAFVNY